MRPGSVASAVERLRERTGQRRRRAGRRVTTYRNLALAAKRGMDVTGAALGIVVLSPVLAWTALAALITQGPPILFRHERPGLVGRPFTMLKFRTMHGSADPYAPSPESPGDERITPIGRWLRRFSLDELPQLINVLRGEMSIVGPRPEMPFLVARYEPWQRRRLDAKPGITGLWQILGRKDLPLVENIEYDFYYIKNQSLLLDMTILLKTLPVVLGGKGAY